MILDKIMFTNYYFIIIIIIVVVFAAVRGVSGH